MIILFWALKSNDQRKLGRGAAVAVALRCVESFAIRGRSACRHHSRRSAHNGSILNKVKERIVASLPLPASIISVCLMVAILAGHGRLCMHAMPKKRMNRSEQKSNQ
nr:hypothetical protein [Pandoravirus massiliensis]